MRYFKTLAMALIDFCLFVKLRVIIGCGVALVCAVPVAAQQLLAVYDTEISPRDRYNSSGKFLDSLCAVVQQDRANYHRFGKRDGPDMGDPVFSDASMRSRITSSCEMVRGHEFLHDVIIGLADASVIIRVRVLEDAGKLRVLVSDPSWVNDY